MRTRCPSCGAVLSLDALIAHDGAREALAVALTLPGALGPALLRYLALFRPANRELTMDRVARLLGELQPMIAAARVERRGRVWPAPVESWRAALEEMAGKRDRLTLPLKSHGYLLEILVGHAERAENTAETQREEKRAYAYSQDRATGASDGPQPLTAVLPTAKRQKNPMPAEVSRRLTELGMATKRPP